MRKVLSLLVAIAILTTSLPVHALEMSLIKNVQSEAELKAAIKGDDLWVENYPKGLFNFVGTQYSVKESQEFFEIAVARQGGTSGDVSVDFKAVDISAEYGKDYVIRVYENSQKTEMKKNEYSIPFVETLQESSDLNISESKESQSDEYISSDISVQEEIYLKDESITGDILPIDEATSSSVSATVYSNRMGSKENQEYIQLDPKTVDFGSENAPRSLRQLKEIALGRESDRPDWKDVDRQTIEQLKTDYDKFFYSVPGAETTIHFKDGEYIKYLYIVPLNDNISESEEQILFALTNPTGDSARGEFYMAYANIADDEAFEKSTFELLDDSVVALNGKASVTIRRTGGISQYASVYVGTEEGTAVAGLDYVPGLQELLFTPGVTQKTVTVDILNNPNRDSYREFKVALDRKNKSVNLDRAEANIVIPSETKPLSIQSAKMASPQLSSIQPLSASISAQSVTTDRRGVEKISKYGFSPQRGQWAVVAQDFLSGWVNQTAYRTGNTLKLRANGEQAYANANNVKLYGVEWVHFALGNSGCGHHWQERQWYPFWQMEDKEEHEFYTEFGISSYDRYAPNLYREWHNQGWHGVDKIYLDENLWNTKWVGFRTWADDKNQSTADIGWLRLNLEQYDIQVKNDSGNVPEFKTTEYKIEDGKLKGDGTVTSAQPGSMSIKAVYSNVKNEKTLSSGTTNTGVFRSDKIEFKVSYADNIIGKNSTYKGFEVYTGGGRWKFYEGTTLSLDQNFFREDGILDAIRSGTIQVRPVFTHDDINLTVKADTNNGYIEGVGEGVASKTFWKLKAGDVISVSARNYNAAMTPSWSSSNNSKLESTDNTGANTSVRFKLSSAENRLGVNFYNPTLKVKANPNVYKHNVSKPVYQIDGVWYNDVESLSQKMDQVFKNDENSDITVSFEYVFDENFPDGNEILDERYDDADEVKEDFGLPADAKLTVYKSDGTVRETYTLKPDNGKYTLSGKLKELGWQAGDYATVIIYGSKRGQQTWENAIDFLSGSGNSITVEKPDGTVVPGDAYNPVIIEKADPVFNYKMSSYLVPGYTAKWADWSGDLDGDGQESPNEEDILEARMDKLGYDLGDIRDISMYNRMFTGNFFNYIPKFFNPSQVLYHFETVPNQSKWNAPIELTEVYRTVLDPGTILGERPIKGATVIVGNKSAVTDENGEAIISDPSFQPREYYSARVLYQGYEYNTYVEPGITFAHTIDTSDIMRPENFKATYYPEREDGGFTPDPVDLKLAKDNTYVPIRNGNTKFEFTVDSGNEGLNANDAVICIYQKSEEGYRIGEPVYEARTGKPEGGIFAHSMDLLAENIKPGYGMTISPLYIRDGEIAKEYPEVDVGLTFSVDLDVLKLSTLASFDTPLSPALEFIGKMDNSFDLGMDVEMGDLEPGTRVDKKGDSHNTKSISFGFNKEYTKTFGDQKDDSNEEEDKSIIDKLKERIQGKKPDGSDDSGSGTSDDSSSSTSDDSSTVKVLAVTSNSSASDNKNTDDAGSGTDKENTEKVVQENTDETAEKKGSGGGTFNFEFATSLSLTIEEGGDGNYYFSSLVLMAKGTAEFDSKYTYVTPIGIPVFASINVTGTATALLAIEPNDGTRYDPVYMVDNNGNIPVNPTDYAIYTKFFVSPSITIGAGVGMDAINAFIEGNATAKFNFTAPILGNNESSSGEGKMVISAKVGIKVLFIQKKWTIYDSDEIELFGYGSETQAFMKALNHPYTNYLYKRVAPVEEDDIISRGYLKKRSGWMEGRDDRSFSIMSGAVASLGTSESDETELLQGAYPYPQTKIVPFDGKLLALFINDPGVEKRDSRNRAQLFYTIYNGSTWSVPLPVDNDNTWDEAPDAFVVEDKILVTWSDAHRTFTSEDDAKTTLQAMNISGKWFDITDSSFGDEFAITKETTADTSFADINPMISYDLDTERLMVYYTKVDHEDTSWDYDNTPATDSSARKKTTDDGDSTTLYGDLVNGYSVITYRYAKKQPDGSFEWNTAYTGNENLPDELYGQRFLDLAIDVDIKETEVVRNPIDPTEDEAGVEKPEGYSKGVIGTETVVERVYGHNDPLVVESDLISYNGLALHTYVMDSDSSKSTIGDQDLYMQIYNYELNEFHHPIKLTNNNVQDSKPQYVRSKGITYLYWISGGDIVYMDITNLVKNNLVKKEIEIGGETRSIYIVDKYYTGIDGYINTAVESRTDYPIDDFTIESNGDSQYLLFTDYVISYKNGLKAGDPGTENPENINKEKQMFAAYCEPQVEIKDVQMFDAYEDTESYQYEFVEGKGRGTYPAKITVAEDVYIEDTGLSLTAGTNVIDYGKMPDVNGYTGAVKAGDAVIYKQYGSSEGYRWSTPVQLTHEEGANYSDISFVVNSDDNIHAVYIKYQQILDDQNSFVEDMNNRIFASAVFDTISTVEADDVVLSEQLPKSKKLLDFSAEVTNKGIKPLTDLRYIAYMTQNDKELAAGEMKYIKGDNGSNINLGGSTAQLYGSFYLPEDITNMVVGFKIIDGNGVEILKTEKALRAETDLGITVLNGRLKDKNTATLSLFIRNEGNIDYDSTLDIFNRADGSILNSQSLNVSVGEAKSVYVDLDINESMFSVAKTAEGGSEYDKIALSIGAGDYTVNTDIKRVADKATVDSVKNVKSFSIDTDRFSLKPGTKHKLNAVTELHTPVPEYKANPLKVTWRTSNADVASVLPDGTVIGLKKGTAEITATLAPKSNATATLSDGSLIDVDNSYRLPASMFLKKSATVYVGDTGSSNTERDNDVGKKEVQEQLEQTVIIQVDPEIKDSKSTIIPDISMIANALQKLREENKPMLTITSSNTTDIEISKLVIDKGVMAEIAGSDAEKVAFDTGSGKMILGNKTLDTLKELASQSEEQQSVTIQISKKSIEDYPGNLKELIGDRPVYDFTILVGHKELGDITADPVPITLELENIPQKSDSDAVNQISGVFISESGEFRLMPLSAVSDGKLLIKTTHNSSYSGVNNDVQFNDVSGWSKEYIDFLSAREIINGKGNSKFSPKDNITRAEFVKIMARVADIDETLVEDTRFDDVDANKWYAPFVKWAYTEGLVNGVGNGLFAPEKNITREDMAVLVTRLSEYLGYKLPILYQEKKFEDNLDIAEYAENSVKTVQQAGIINGKSGGMFAPKDQATREECAKMIALLIKIIVTE